MADLTLNANSVALQALSRLPKERTGERRSRPRRFQPIDRHATIVSELFPASEGDYFEVYMELDGGQFIGVAVVDTRIGEVVTHVSVQELNQQAEHPGHFFERAA